MLKFALYDGDGIFKLTARPTMGVAALKLNKEERLQ